MDECDRQSTSTSYIEFSTSIDKEKDDGDQTHPVTNEVKQFNAFCFVLRESRTFPFEFSARRFVCRGGRLLQHRRICLLDGDGVG